MIEKINFQYTDDITVVDRDQFEAHIRLYEGYVKKINEIDEILQNNPGREEANATFSFFRECKRGETYALDGVILHELYLRTWVVWTDEYKSVHNSCWRWILVVL